MRAGEPGFVGLLTVLVAAALFVYAQEDCSYDKSSPKAIIGRTMVLNCTVPCFSGPFHFKWHQIFGDGSRELLNETSATLVVSEKKVTSAAEVGGRLYECNCSTTGSCRKYNISVIPRATLTVTPKVARSGSSVNITCTADSYPPATEGDYTMEHPQETPISKKSLPNGRGVVHEITAANESDDGEYKCTVMVMLGDEYGGESIQSNTSEASLTVYDQPMIVNVSNFTISHCVNQLAVLECIITNREIGLLVWVNWTTSTGVQLHTTSQNGDVFYLLVYNATVGDYVCHLFSAYSPEDTRTATIDLGPGTSCPICALGSKSQNGDCTVILGVMVPILFLALLIIAALAILVVVLKKSCRQQIDPSNTPGPGTTEPNDSSYDPSPWKSDTIANPNVSPLEDRTTQVEGGENEISRAESTNKTLDVANSAAEVQQPVLAQTSISSRVGESKQPMEEAEPTPPTGPTEGDSNDQDDDSVFKAPTVTSSPSQEQLHTHHGSESSSSKAPKSLSPTPLPGGNNDPLKSESPPSATTGEEPPLSPLVEQRLRSASLGRRLDKRKRSRSSGYHEMIDDTDQPVEPSVSGRAKPTKKAVRFIEPESSDNKNETSTNTEAQATGRSHTLPPNLRLFGSGADRNPKPQRRHTLAAVESKPGGNPGEIKRRDKVRGESKSQRRRSFPAGKHDESTESLL